MPPKIIANPDIFHDIDMQVLGEQGNRPDPQLVKWQQSAGLTLRQSPEPTSPLGRVAFRITNPFLAYLHGTPNQYLFARPNSKNSSDWVRVEDVSTPAEHLCLAMGEAQLEAIALLLESTEC